jgi:hypothetical protein
VKLTAFDRFESEIELLLPFYVTGRLSLRDVQRIEAALREDPSLRAKVALVREERAAVVLQNEELGEPAANATRRFLTKLAAEPRPARQSISRRIFCRLRRIVDLRLSRRSVGAFAVHEGCCVAIAAFSVDARLSAVGDLLSREKAVIIDGPRPAGLFILRIGSDIERAECDKTLSRLTGEKGLIRFLMRAL